MATPIFGQKYVFIAANITSTGSVKKVVNFPSKNVSFTETIVDDPPINRDIAWAASTRSHKVKVYYVDDTER